MRSSPTRWSSGPPRRVQSKWLFLLGLNLVLLFVGGLVEIYAAIVVVVPLLVPLGVAFGIDPIHLGIIFLANMELGFLCPPVGLNLLLSSYRFNKPMSEVTRATMPDVAGLAGGRAADYLLPAAHDVSAALVQITFVRVSIALTDEV